MRRFPPRITGAFAVTVGLYASPMSAQQVITIPDQVDCATCAIDLPLLTTLSPPSHIGAFTPFPFPSLARNSRQFFFAGPMLGDSVIAVFRPSGAFDHFYGRRGGGPDEFAAARLSMILRVGEGDDLYVGEGPDLHVLGATATTTLRKTRIDIRGNDMVILGRTPIVQASIYEPNGRSTPLQIISEDGKSATGIGITSARPMVRSRVFDSLRRITLDGSGRRVWSSYANRFEFSRFDLEGREEVRVVRDADWFAPYDDLLQGEGLHVPQRPRVEGIVEANDGLLWVVISRGDKNFESIGPPAGEVPLNTASLDYNRFYDTVIEVIDPWAGRVLARTESEFYLKLVRAVDNSVILYSLRLRDDGEFVCDIFAAELRNVGR
jgi:hypothetical protein